MMLPLYHGHQAPGSLPGNAHPGLWWEKFFSYYERDWAIPEKIRQQDKDKNTKQVWIETLFKKDAKEALTGRERELKEFAYRQYALGRGLGARQKALKTDWHFTTGLGLPHPVENGFAWHPTLGVPYLPGAAVKGLLRAWVEEWQEFETAQECNETKTRWFGDQEQAGTLIFFDAIPVDRVKLIADVMTPHRGKWYEKGDDTRTDSADRVPADWHSAVPLPFLVVKQAIFLFQIASRPGTRGAGEAETAMRWLQNALEFLGAGAKTAAGYGRMSEDASALARLQTRFIQTQPLETADAEKVSMREPPAAGSVHVKTQDDKHISCTGFEPEDAQFWWDSGFGEFTAVVKRRNGVAVSAVWQAW
jgi:CRISPR-associated protein Cmr6